MTDIITNIPFEGWLPPESVLSYRLGNYWTGLIQCGEGKNSFDHIKSDKSERTYYALGGIIRNALDIKRSYQEASRIISWVRSAAMPFGVYLHEDQNLHELFEGLAHMAGGERSVEAILGTADCRLC